MGPATICTDVLHSPEQAEPFHDPGNYQDTDFCQGTATRNTGKMRDAVDANCQNRNRLSYLSLYRSTQRAAVAESGVVAGRNAAANGILADQRGYLVRTFSQNCIRFPAVACISANGDGE